MYFDGFVFFLKESPISSFKFKKNFLLRKVNTIEFELNNFSKQFNQNKKTDKIFSPEHHFGAYNWSLGADVDKDSQNQFILCTSLQCKPVSSINFLTKVLIKFSILNCAKDSRKDFVKCKRIF